MKKSLLAILASLSFILGIIGIFLPILPTTPFLILSAYLFSKVSPRIQQKILNLPYIGNGLKDWHENKVISLKGKILSISSIIMTFSLTLYFVPLPHIIFKIMIIILGLFLIVFISSQKSSVNS